MPIYVNKDGAEASFSSPEAIAKAQAEGWTPRDDTSNVVDPLLGRAFAYDQEAVPGQLEQGGQLESAGAAAQGLYEDIRGQEYGGVGGGLKALGLGVARGASLGLSDAFLKGVGVDTADLRGYAEENPGLTTAAELGGAVGTSVATGGLGTAGLAAKGAAGAAAAGVIEGTAFGAAQSASHLIINDVPLASEAGLAELGLGALLGGVSGGTVGLVAHGAGKAFDAVKGRTARSAEEAALASEVTTPQNLAEVQRRLGSDAKKATKVLHETADDLFDTAQRVAQGHEVTGSPEQLRLWASERQTLLNEQASRLLSSARAANLGERRLAKLNRALYSSTKTTGVALKPGVRVDAKSFSTIQRSLHSLEGEVRAVAKKLDVKMGIKQSPTARAITSKLDELDNKFHTLTGTGKVADRIKGTKSLPRRADPELRTAMEEAQSAREMFRADWGLTKTDVLNEAAFRRFSKMAPDEAASAAASWANYQKHLEGLAARFPSAGFDKALAASATEMQRIVQRAAPGTLDRPTADLMRELGMDLGLFGLSDQVPDLPGPADELLKVYLVGRVLKSGGRVAGDIAASGGKGFLGRAQNVAAGYAAQRAAGAAAKGLGASGGAAGFVMRTQGAGLIRGGIHKLLGGAGSMSKVTGKALARLEAATQAILGGVSKAKRGGPAAAATILNKVRYSLSPDEETKHHDIYGAFQARSEELSNAAANKMATHQMLYNALTPVRQFHPELADAMEMQAVAQIDFLYDKMPKDPGVIKSFGKSRWKADEGALHRWANYCEAVEDPIGVVEQVADGTVTPQGAEVLRTLFPRLYQEVQMMLVANTEQLQKNSTYDQRGRLSILFGVPVDSSRSPEFSQYSQKFWADRAAEREPMEASNLQPNEPSEGQKNLGP